MKHSPSGQGTATERCKSPCNCPSKADRAAIAFVCPAPACILQLYIVYVTLFVQRVSSSVCKCHIPPCACDLGTAACSRAVKEHFVRSAPSHIPAETPVCTDCRQGPSVAALPRRMLKSATGGRKQTRCTLRESPCHHAPECSNILEAASVASHIGLVQVQPLRTPRLRVWHACYFKQWVNELLIVVNMFLQCHRL